MTEKLYYQNAYIKDFKATIVSISKCSDEKILQKFQKIKRIQSAEILEIILDRTAFFPEGGGQYADTGKIGTYEVIDVQEIKESGDIVHYCAGKEDSVQYDNNKEDYSLNPNDHKGKKISGSVDFVTRFDRMQQHSGEHIVSGLVHSEFGYENVGFHLGDEETTLDFSGELNREQLDIIEERANKAIYDNKPILCEFPDKESLEQTDYRSKKELDGDIRIVTIPGIDICACCAPHVANTGEIGLIKLVEAMRHRGGTRVTLLAGKRALKDYKYKSEIIKNLSEKLSLSWDNIIAGVDNLFADRDAYREKLIDIQIKILTERLYAKLSVLTDGSENGQENVLIDEKIILYVQETEKMAIKLFLENAWKIMGSGMLALLVGEDGKGYQYHIISKNIDLKEWVKDFNKKYSGKGGGKRDEVHGSLAALQKDISL